MVACIFCRIAAGEIPSHKVHEDDRVLAFLDIAPLARGHVLVIPKRHAPLLEDLTTDEVMHLFETVHRLAPRARDAVGASATTIAVNNGRASGQEVEHLHVHIVPRREGDGGGPIHAIMRSRPRVPSEEMERIAKKSWNGHHSASPVFVRRTAGNRIISFEFARKRWRRDAFRKSSTRFPNRLK